MSQPQSRFSRGDVIAKKYEIERFLGDGMIASSYVARHINSGKEVVIKFIRPNLVASPRDQERCRKLFDRARAVRHDLLTRYGELGTHEEFLYITEEFFAGESLRDVIKAQVAEKKAFSLHEACQIAISVLQAADAGHQAGIIHRNIKPENVLVASRRTGPAANPKIVREIKVSGLGLAGIINPTIFAESFVNRAEAPYLAPELSGFDQDGGPQADVYSVGVMLYELLCGQRPMGTYLSPTQLRDDLPEHLDDIVEIALAHNPEDRYPTPKDMINDIQRSFSLENLSSGSKLSFRGFLIGLGVVLVGVAGIGTWVVVSETDDPVAVAREQDEALRRKVQAENPLPTDSEVKAMIEKHPEMVYVPAGTYVHGRLKAERMDVAVTGEPVSTVEKVDAFYIDRFEFPNRKGAKPATRVSWADAAAACADANKRLCTEIEWEKACKGPANLIYSYADDFKPETCGTDLNDPYTLGSRPECVTGYGVYDMSGGVREWTLTDVANQAGRRIVKGGLRGTPQRGTRCAYSMDESDKYGDPALGFRCCLNADDDGSAAPAPTEPGAAPAEPPAQ